MLLRWHVLQVLESAPVPNCHHRESKHGIQAGFSNMLQNFNRLENISCLPLAKHTLFIIIMRARDEMYTNDSIVPGSLFVEWCAGKCFA
jgi:hypothetical protein